MVQSKQSQTRNSLYAVKVFGEPSRGDYSCEKFSQEGDLLDTYHIHDFSVDSKVSTHMICTCIAGAKLCRHQKFLIQAKALGRIGKGWLYNVDKDTWIEPTEPE